MSEGKLIFVLVIHFYQFNPFKFFQASLESMELLQNIINNISFSLLLEVTFIIIHILKNSNHTKEHSNHLLLNDCQEPSTHFSS